MHSTILQQTKENIIHKETGKVHSLEEVPTLPENDKKLKVLTNMANAFTNLFVTVTEKFNIQCIEKGAAVSVPKDPPPGNFPSIKINLITEAGIKSIIHSLTPKKNYLLYDEITSKILKRNLSVISQPLSYIDNHLLC